MRAVLLAALLFGGASACAGGHTKIGGITSVNPTCVGLVKASGFCFSPPAGAPTLRVGDCVRVAYKSTHNPGQVKVSKIAELDPATHRDHCPAG